MRWTRDSLFVTGLMASSLFLTGLSAASTTPYRSVVAVEGLHLSNATFAMVMTFNALATAVSSVVLGALSDRVGDRRVLVMISAAMGGLAYGLIFLVPGQLSFMLAYCLILPLGGALFSQSFAFARAYYDQNAPERSQVMTSILRTMFSAAWVVVPPIAGWIAAVFSVFDVFAFAAIGHVGCMLIFGVMLTRADARVPPPPRRPKTGQAFWRVLPAHRLVGITGMLALRAAVVLHFTVLPLAMLNDYHGTYTDLGYTGSLAALLEIPFMLGWGFLAARVSKEIILIGNAALYGAYMLAMTQVTTPSAVLWLQLPNAVATAALVSLTISYMQDSIKGQVGLSTSLLDVVMVGAMLLTSAIFPLVSREDAYVGGFLAGAAAALAGSALVTLALVMSRRDRAV